MTLVNFTNRLQRNLIPSIDNRKINAWVYKTAKKQLANKGFAIEPKIAIQKLQYKRNRGVAKLKEATIIINSKRALELFIFPKKLTEFINHESKHLEQKALVIINDSLNQKPQTNLSKFAQKFYFENTKLVKFNKNRVEKLIVARKRYPKKSDYYSNYEKVKNAYIPWFLKPFLEPYRIIDATIKKIIAGERYKKSHHANFLEIEAIAAQNNNGSVFKY